MSIRRYRKLGNNTYVYEEESYWDTEKQQGRKKLRYLGKQDPKTKKITPSSFRFAPHRKLRPRVVGCCS